MTVNQHRSGTPDGSAKDWFAQLRGRSIFSPMFLVTEAAAGAIRAVLSAGKPHAGICAGERRDAFPYRDKFALPGFMSLITRAANSAQESRNEREGSH